MDPFLLKEAISRIQQIEAVFDGLQKPGAREQADFQAQLSCLLRYYESGLWLQDYRLDEEGHLPPDLKRGVLSEDGVYNLLSELDKQRGGA